MKTHMPQLKALAGAALACVILLGLSVALFGPAPRGRDGDMVYVGYYADPQLFVWFLNWLPFAWHHHFHLFHTDFIFAPFGTNLVWHTSIPALSLISAPFTERFGALTVFNALIRISPGLAGIGAFFAARELTGRLLPAFVAGLVFGFSTYEIGQSISHLNLAFTVAIPLLVWAGLRAARHNWPPALLAIVAGVLFAFQFGISQEIAASFLVLVVLAAGWLWVRGPSLRPALRRIAPGAIGGCAIAFTIVAPLLFLMAFGGGRQDISIAPPTEYSTDLLNFVVPTAVTWPLSHWAAPIADQFYGNNAENAGYLGLPLILLLLGIGLRPCGRILPISDRTRN